MFISKKYKVVSLIELAFNKILMDNFDKIVSFYNDYNITKCTTLASKKKKKYNKKGR